MAYRIDILAFGFEGCKPDSRREGDEKSGDDAFMSVIHSAAQGIVRRVHQSVPDT
jgi:hypothetical protein